MRAREKGAFVIALTSMAYSRSVSSRHPSGKRLFEVSDLVIDNCGCVGDASVAVEGLPEKVAPTSTAVGAAMVNAMMAQAVADIIAAGGVAPVFVSANLDAGGDHNQRMMEKYRHHIFYMGAQG